jgi:hypothetical protein
MSAKFAIQNVHSVMVQLILNAANVPKVIFSLHHLLVTQHVRYYTMELRRHYNVRAVFLVVLLATDWILINVPVAIKIIIL